MASKVYHGPATLWRLVLSARSVRIWQCPSTPSLSPAVLALRGPTPVPAAAMSMSMSPTPSSSAYNRVRRLRTPCTSWAPGYGIHRPAVRAPFSAENGRWFSHATPKLAEEHGPGSQRPPQQKKEAQESTQTSEPESEPEPKAKPRSASSARPLRKVLSSALPAAVAHENIYTVPNLLTFSRLVAAPFIGYCILHDYHAWALGLFAYAGISDVLDGWIARRWNLKTVVGSVVDPMADKMLMTVLVVSLAAKGALPIWLAAIILGRDVGLGVAAIYYRWISLPPPKTFVRYWDFSLPSAEVRPTTISKYNTFLQLALMGVTTVAPLVPVDLGTSLAVMQYVVAATTVWSGASYVFSKDAVKILSQSARGTK